MSKVMVWNMQDDNEGIQQRTRWVLNRSRSFSLKGDKEPGDLHQNLNLLKKQIGSLA
jgi:hypothetical protein